MNRSNLRAALAVLILGLCIAGCGGAAEQTDATTRVAEPTTVAELGEPTKPPPIVAVNATAIATTDPAAPTATDSAAGDSNAPPPSPTPLPTAVLPTASPTTPPTATAIPPTAVPPTAVPPTAVPPTAAPPTAIPPTAAPTVPPAPSGVNGLSGAHFALQDRADLSVNGRIWFEFHVANATGGDVPFDALGVMPKKDGVDRPEWYQNSWGGNNDVIDVDGLNWEDHIELPEAGNYTLRLVICFDGAACRQNNGTWHTLSSEIPVTIN